jgi:hypothetical protein
MLPTTSEEIATDFLFDKLLFIFFDPLPSLDWAAITLVRFD